MPSAQLLDHCRHPRNVGVLADDGKRVGRGLERSPDCGDTLQLQVKLDAEGALIEQARFKAFGCSATIAAGSFVTDWLAGRQVAEAVERIEAVIVAALDLSSEEGHAATLAARVVRAAIDDGRRRGM